MNHPPSATAPVPFVDPRDRRREPRLEFTNRCQLSVVSPAWAITRKPLECQTENITLNGVRLNGLKTEPGQAANWSEAVDQDIELLVEVQFLGLEEFPALRGRIVWVFEGEFDRGSTAIGVPCSVGILFSVLRDRETKALDQLMKQLPARF